MDRRIFAALALMGLTGCPYTEGCDAPVDASAAEPSIVESDAEPDSGIITEEGTADASADARRTLGPSGSIDFGADPVGGPSLSTLVCPELAMPANETATVYVDGSATGAEDGTKAAPFRTIDKAFASAGSRGIIWVAAGKYKENLVIPDKDLLVRGGFVTGFARRTSACDSVVDAGNTTSAPVLSAADDVLSFTIEGFTIQNGARGIAATGNDANQASFTIARCVFSGNGTNAGVGGAAALESVNARIFRSVFKDNRASKGAAIASNGKVTFTADQNLFERNLGYSDHGGALYLSASSSKVTRNTFRSNATGVGIPAGFGGNWGGAVIVYNNSPQVPAKADLAFNVFTDNLAGIGSAVFVDEAATMTMSHDLIYRNRAYLENGFIRGGAIYVDGTGEAGGGSTFTGEYLTVVNNNLDENRVTRAPSAAFGGNVYVEGFSKASVTSSLFWNNGDNGFYVEAQNELSVRNSIGAPQCTSSNAEGFVPASATICKIGVGVFLPAAVYFGDEATNDYHEMSTAGRFNKGAWLRDAFTSPAIDKGDPAATIGNEPAPHGGRANLGVFARTPEASKSP